MCADCDGGSLGPKENRFMQAIFRPYHADNDADLAYDADLHYFAASLAFRVMILEKAWHTSREGVDFREFEVPLRFLRRYLRGLSNKPEGLEHYITLTADIDDFMRVTETPDEFTIQHGMGRVGFDLMRGVDAFAVNLGGHLITFVQMPGFLFATVLKPRRYRGPLGSRINVGGGVLSFNMGDLIANDLFHIVEARSKRLDGIVMSDQQAKKVEQMVQKNPTRWDKSETARLAPRLKR